MSVTEKELGEALQAVAEHLHATDILLAKIGAGLTAVKAVLALQMDPVHPKEALAKIETIESDLAKLDPNASTRQKLGEVIEMIKLVDKHGGPKEA